MCGIAGFLIKPTLSDGWQSNLERMAASLDHRGPDDEGIWFDIEAGIGMAHRRLSIIDLSQEGHQPMTSAFGRYVIVYNGEVYNFNLLRRELKKQQYNWRGHSDTEVVLAAVEAWGLERALGRFVGMFAFALWDKLEQTLYLCRDRLGIKPLYYSRTPKGLLYGSELKALKAHPDFQPVIDRNALTLYLRYNCIPSPYSIFRNTWKLEPGCILKVTNDLIRHDGGLPAAYPYWSAKDIAIAGKKQTVSNIGENETLQALENLLLDAVKMRMISDVPLGVFLSGGVDSSTVAALMQSRSATAVKTFTIGFNEQDYNEAKQARSVAEHLGTDHTELYVTPDDALTIIPDLPTLFDEPFSDSSQIPTYLLSKLTRRHVTVCLSGDGGDELFGGYNRYRWIRKILEIQKKMPSVITEKAAWMACEIAPQTWDRLFGFSASLLPQKYRIRAAGDKIHKFATAFSSRTPEDIYYRLVSHWQQPEKIVLNGAEPVTRITDLDNHPKLHGHIQLMMYLDLVTYLPDDILAKVDRASMGASLEARVPFLDHRVVELAWRIPIHMKIREGQSKWILRKILYKYVPRELIERPKSGFSIPLDSWLRGPLRDWGEALLDKDRLKSEGFFNPKQIRLKWKEHLSGRRNWQYHLWDILMFQAWLERQ